MIDYLKIPEIQVTFKDNFKTSERVKVQTSVDIFTLMKDVFNECMQHHEEVYALYLNAQTSVLGISFISRGAINKALVDFRIILQIALKTNASAIILSHNHPGGETNPSTEDKKLTRDLKEACKLLNIKLLDHLILTEDNYYSFADEGMIL